MVGKHVKFLVSNYIYSFAAVLAICVCIVLLVFCMFLGVWSLVSHGRVTKWIYVVVFQDDPI